MLVHLKIISAKSDKIYRKQIKTFVCQAGFVKKKRFFAVSVCLRFERPVEVAEMKTTHSFWVVVVQKKVTRFHRNVNAF